MEEWSIGAMEYWSNGVLEYWMVGVLEGVGWDMLRNDFYGRSYRGELFDFQNPLFNVRQFLHSSIPPFLHQFRDLRIP
jgi:hypothetical protein